MTTIAWIFLCAWFAEIGFLLGLAAFDKVLYQPLKKHHARALQGWDEALDLLSKHAVFTKTVVQQENKSMVSPWQQIKK